MRDGLMDGWLRLKATRVFGVPASDWGPLLLLGALIAAFFRRILFAGECLFERDVGLILYSYSESFAQVVARGSLPLWNPYMSFGQPLLANANAQPLYPATWINLVLHPQTAYTVLVALHFLLGAVGMYFLGRRLGLSRRGAFLVGCAWVFSGPFVSLVNLWHHLMGAAWIGWVLWATDRAASAPSGARGAVIGALACLQVLAGSSEVCMMTALLGVPLVLRHLTMRPLLGRTNARVVACVAGGAVVALALSAVQWLPTLAAARVAARWETRPATQDFWSLHPASLPQALVPLFLQDLPLKTDLRQILFEGREPFIGSLYLGLVACSLVLAAMVWSRRRLVWAFAALGAFAVLLALGRYGIFYAAAKGLLPALGLIRYPSKFMIMAACVWALLVGFGYDQVFARSQALTARGIAAVVVPFGLLTAAASWLAFAPPETWLLTIVASPAREAFDLVQLPLVLASVAGIIALGLAVAHSTKKTLHLGPLGAALVIADLFLAHQARNPTAPVRLMAQTPAAVGAMDRGPLTRVFPFGYTFSVMGKSYSGRTFGPPQVTDLPDISPKLRSALGLRAGLAAPSAQQYGLYGSYEMDILLLFPRGLRNLCLFETAMEDTPAFPRLLRLGAIDYVVSQHEGRLEGLIPRAVLANPYSSPVRVFQVQDPLSRTYLVAGSVVADGLQALRILADPNFDMTRAIVLPEGSPMPSPAGFIGQSRLRLYRPDRVLLETLATGPGFAVLVDSFDEGWKAFVDGEPTPILRANVAFRAVPVTAGAHVVEMVYRPTSAILGASISAGTLLLVGVLSVLQGFRRRMGSIPAG